MQPVSRYATRNIRNSAHKNTFDDYPTPPWGTRALMEYALPELGFEKDAFKSWTVWECAANRGFMQRALKEYFGEVFATDIHDYGCGNLDSVYDFIGDEPMPDKISHAMWKFPKSEAEKNKFAIITNPPFILAEDFVRRAFDYPAARIVAIFARTNFLESESRYNGIYKAHPPAAVASFTKRIPLFAGRINPNGSTATSYAWFIWDRNRKIENPIHLWIPPQARKKLEREGDYLISGIMGNSHDETQAELLTG